MQYVCQSLTRLLVLVISSMIVGCASFPSQEMSDARQAIKSARDVHAEQYVPNSLASAERVLSQAESHLETGYLEQARLSAVMAKDEAVKAHDMATALDKAKILQQAIATLEQPTEEIQALLIKAEVAAQQDDASKTLYYANEAHRQAELALNQAYLKQAQPLIAKVKNTQEKLQPNELALLKTAELAYLSNEGKKAYTLIKELSDKLH